MTMTAHNPSSAEALAASVGFDLLGEGLGGNVEMAVGTALAAGAVGTGASFPFGPYMQNAPMNPLNSKATVAAAAAAGVGWVYDETTGKILATDQTQLATLPN